jgi:hypothetical protein
VRKFAEQAGVDTGNLVGSLAGRRRAGQMTLAKPQVASGVASIIAQERLLSAVELRATVSTGVANSGVLLATLGAPNPRLVDHGRYLGQYVSLRYAPLQRQQVTRAEERDKQPDRNHAAERGTEGMGHEEQQDQDGEPPEHHQRQATHDVAAHEAPDPQEAKPPAQRFNYDRHRLSD